jgi:hypothetical protein
MNTRERLSPRFDDRTRPGLTRELLLLADERILVHNLTPAFAAVLRELNPADEQIQPRVASIAAGRNEPRARATEK